MPEHQTTTPCSNFTRVSISIKAKSLAAALLAVFVVTISAPPAGAHTGFESSSPAEGDVVNEPVSEIALTFSGEATPAGEGFVVLDPTGTVREPDEITTADNLIWILRFDEPLVAGDVGVRWMVAAPDAHPIEGSFSFTVAAPAPTEDTTAEADEPQDAGEATTDEPEAVDELTESDTATNEQEESVESASAPASTDSEPVDLESFLDTSDAKPAALEAVAAVARILSLLGAVLVIGGATFAVFGLRDLPSDVQPVLNWVRGGGALLVIGAFAEAVTTTATLAGQWSALLSYDDLRNALWSSTGLAVALRATGGFLAASKTNMNTAKAMAVGYRIALGGLLGVALVAVSFMFDGHTASEGPRWLHAVVNLAHVTAATIWAGGVAMLALTIQRRRRTNQPTQALQLAMRFSVIATAALIGAGLAGTALSVIVLDSVSDLWATPWGRLLIAKVGVVAVAAAGGAYNHRIIVPALDQTPDDRATIDRFRTVVTLEAAALIAVAVITAFLIAASST